MNQQIKWDLQSFGEWWEVLPVKLSFQNLVRQKSAWCMMQYADVNTPWHFQIPLSSPYACCGLDSELKSHNIPHRLRAFPHLHLPVFIGDKQQQVGSSSTYVNRSEILNSDFRPFPLKTLPPLKDGETPWSHGKVDTLSCSSTGRIRECSRKGVFLKLICDHRSALRFHSKFHPFFESVLFATEQYIRVGGEKNVRSGISASWLPKES